MKTKKIGVGIIGASPYGGWASISHVPAIQNLSEFELVAVCTSRQESADEAAKKFNVLALTDPYELSLHPDVDVVVITVKVPEHARLVKAALNAGKHVYCEWPLARTTSEALELLSLAEDKGVRHVIGLQGRANPAINYVKDLISDGYVGEVQSVKINYEISTFPNMGNTINESHVYFLDEYNGADQLTIGAGHLLDGIHHIFGEFSQVSARLETKVKEVNVIETGDIVSATAPDHVEVDGILSNTATISLRVSNTDSDIFSMKISGTEGMLHLNSKDKLMFEMDPFTLEGSQENGDLKELEIPSSYYLVPSELRSGAQFNVAQLYAQFYQDLATNKHETPDFQIGVQVHRLMDVIREAATTGTKQVIQ
ncbi:Gfo/Idh/MocA family protein [Paenibacillus massiliensis]|uniref:Gfo/Idh/MocA family protein n=1 Tax=Paenibacillus massiliensis TaxID=225917 RepID=UPI0003777C86|nr:Gfo/Idh/MocA family oxidoreductase [Paenibacillus massiliensis]